MRSSCVLCVIFICILPHFSCAQRQACLSGVTPDGTSLLSGDILLGRASGFLPAVAASLGSPKTDFAHAGVYFVDEGGCGRVMHMQPGGLQVVSVTYFYQKYYRVGIMRSGVVDGGRVDRSCRRIIARHQSAPIVADFTGSRQQAEDGSMFCLTLINKVFADAGGQRPFVKEWRFDGDPLVRVLASIAGAKNKSSTAVAAIFYAKDFELVGDWLNPGFDLKLMRIDDEIVAGLRGVLGRGYMIRQPKFYTRVWIDALMPCRDIVQYLVNPGLRKMLQQIGGANDLAAMYMISKFVKAVRSDALCLVERGVGVEIAVREAVLGNVSDYFTKDLSFALIYPPRLCYVGAD